MDSTKVALPELLTKDTELGDWLDELNELKKQMYDAQEAAMEKAAEPYIKKIEELEQLISVSHRMIS